MMRTPVTMRYRTFRARAKLATAGGPGGPPLASPVSLSDYLDRTQMEPSLRIFVDSMVFKERGDRVVVKTCAEGYRRIMGSQIDRDRLEVCLQGFLGRPVEVRYAVPITVVAPKGQPLAAGRRGGGGLFSS